MAGNKVRRSDLLTRVNRFGGYAGMKPATFVILSWHRRVGFPRERLILGGDRTGPNCWQTNLRVRR